MTLTGPYQPSASGNTRQAVVLLHGYGADGNDLIGLAPMFAQALPDAAFYSPHAPQPCEMAPYGRQWFSLSAYDPDLMRRNPGTMVPAFAAMEGGAIAAAPDLTAYLEQIQAHEGLGMDSIALIGFSQGTMMALHVGLRLTPAPKAVVGYSGALLGSTLPADTSACPPVLLIHGEDDPVVPFAAMQAAATQLRAAGVETQTLARPGLEHGIDDAGIIAAVQFLRDAFGLTDDA